MPELRGLSLSPRNILMPAPGSELAGVEDAELSDRLQSLERRKGLLRPLKSLGGLIRRSRVPKLLVSESENSLVRSLGRPRLRELFLETTFITFLSAGLLLLPPGGCLPWNCPFLLLGWIRVSFNLLRLLLTIWLRLDIF